MNPLKLRESTPEQEGLLKVSKFLSLQVLIDDTEMEQLVASLPSFQIIAANGVTEQGKGEVNPKDFLQTHASYIDVLKNGELPDPKDYRARFYDSWTVDTDLLYAVPVGDRQQLIKSTKPLIQLQAHQIAYAQSDGRFRPMGMGKNAITWGIQFSYPQLYQDPKTQELEKVDQSERFPNTSLFRKLQQWVRKNTVPTPFEVDSKRSNVPMRLGKQCLEWINQHPQLREQGIRVLTDVMKKEAPLEN